MEMRCPCCRKPMEEPLPRESLKALQGLTLQQRRIVQRLARRPGMAVSRDELIEAFTGNPEDGGPLTANGILNVHIIKIRPRLAPFGWKNITNYGYGYTLEPTR